MKNGSIYILIAVLITTSFYGNWVIGSPNPDLVTDTPVYSQFLNLTRATITDTSTGYSFSDVSVGVYDSNDVLRLTGNGQVMYNLTEYGSEVTVPKGSFLTFTMIDFGEESDGTYAGMQFVMRAEDNSTKSVYIAKHYVGTYSNTSSSILKFASPSISYGMYWERWGISTDLMYDFFGVDTLTMKVFRVIHASSISFNGDRKVYYQQPMFTSSLQRDEDAEGGYYGKSLRSNFQFMSFKNPQAIFDPAESINKSIVFESSNDRVFSLIKYNQEVNESMSYVKLGGNGVLRYNLTELGVTRSFSSGSNESLVFRWYDFGGQYEAAYIGVVVVFKDADGSSYDMVMVKRYTGYFENSSNSMYLFNDHDIQVDLMMEYYGVPVDSVLDYFGVSGLTLDSIQFIQDDQYYYYGSKKVAYFSPLVVENLTRGEGGYGPYLEARDYSYTDSGEKIILQPITETVTDTVTDTETVTETTTVVSINESVITEYVNITDISNITVNSSAIPTSPLPVSYYPVLVAVVFTSVVMGVRRRVKLSV